MLHTGLHDQYHRPSDDVEFVNFDGIPQVSRLTLALTLAIADDDERLSFRPESRSESNATKRRLEESRPPQGPSQSPSQRRWGIVSRADPGEPACPVVVDVVRDSPAAKAGLRAGDTLLAVGEQQVESLAAFYRAVWGLGAPGVEVRLALMRRGKAIEATLKSADRADFFRKPRLQ